MKRSLCVALYVVASFLCGTASLQAQVPTATPPAPSAPEPPKIDGGDTAWIIMATGLVMLMVPGLALFYAGMVRRKNVLGTMMHSMVALAIVGVQWLLYGYSLAFGTSLNGWIGWEPDLLGLNGVLSNKVFPNTHIPVFVHCMYQGMFAIITPALISGAVAERVRFGPYCLFILLWATLVYDPLAHWVWAVNEQGQPAGWLAKMGALDFAGGTVVHIAAGLSGLAAILVLRRRLGYPTHAIHPNSMVLTLIGAGLLWFGWFGFNGGSALAANGLAGAALTATQIAAAAAALSWMLVEWRHRGKPTALGFASGAVAGLVAVTPASGYVAPLGALSIGLLAGIVCYLAVAVKPFLKYDDSLDAFGVHGVGGFLGAILTGVFASAALYQAGAGSTDPLGALGAAGDLRIGQVKVQIIAALVAVGYSFLVSLVLVKVIDVTWGFCLTDRQENEGLDHNQHGEVGFDFSLATDEAAESGLEPRAAAAPPNGKRRFAVVIDGPRGAELIQVWASLCQSGPPTPPPEFLALYPHVTTVRRNRFCFRDGDPALMSATLERLFAKRFQDKIVTHVE